MRFARKASSSLWLALLEELGAKSAAFSSTARPALVRFPLRIRDADRRKALLRESEERGAGISPAYPRSINRLAELQGHIPAQDCPAAERYARELVTLPTHAYLMKRDFALIKGLLARALSPAKPS
jgi:dTDP-4-amino-4,6-dideoxygalactose transaminase